MVMEKEKLKLFFFRGMIVFEENPKESIDKTLK